jgi:epoxyqueuosine reductase
MKIALHICCAVCAAGAVERLQQEGYEVVGYFYNPNIYPVQEYKLRLDSTRRVAEELNIEFVEGLYDTDLWYRAVAGLENEPEGGKRCPVCFKMRMQNTYQFMLESGCDMFATTLTMGSNKSGKLMEQLGAEIDKERYLARDFKKKDGFKRANELARRWGLYRQNYCGCVFSLRESEDRRKLKTQ